jgi:DNA-binding NarL/FixJ family response regulator
VIKEFARIPRTTPPEEFDDPTAREQEIVRLIAGGLSNAEIARELFISDTTVKTQITHVLQKLNLVTACKWSYSRTRRDSSRQLRCE